jgi:hypothetical protein
MTKEINEKELRKELIGLYENYSKDKDIKSEAKKLFLEYSTAENFLNKETYDAIMKLEGMGWDLRNKTTIEEAKEILKKLEND